jgi:GNAT superfamily N-acetyltransferase
MADPAGYAVAGVRRADPGDAPFITGLAEPLAAMSRLPWLPAVATDEFAAGGCAEAVAAIGQSGHVVLIATDGAGRRLGFLHACLDQSVFTGDRVGYVSAVVVSASAAGAGVGRTLMQSAEEWARNQGCGLMTLEVFGQNAAARAVYARLGGRSAPSAISLSGFRMAGWTRMC